MNEELMGNIRLAIESSEYTNEQFEAFKGHDVVFTIAPVIPGAGAPKALSFRLPKPMSELERLKRQIDELQKDNEFLRNRAVETENSEGTSIKKTKYQSQITSIKNWVMEGCKLDKKASTIRTYVLGAKHHDFLVQSRRGAPSAFKYDDDYLAPHPSLV